MTIGKILDHIIDEADKAMKDSHINKPISYALYQTWQWCDEREKNRNEKGGREQMTIAEKNKDKLYEIAKSGNKVAVTVCGKIQTCKETPCNICIAGCVDESCAPVIRQYLSREADCEFEQDELVEVSDNGTEWRIRHFADINVHSDEYHYHVYDAGYTSKDNRVKIPYKYCRKYGTLGGLIKDIK